MKKFISILVLLSMIPSLAFADCDWKTIQKTPQGQYLFSETLYLCVGQLVQDNKTKDAQIADYQKAIQLKDLAITNADARSQMWETTAGNENDRLQKVESDKSHSDWLYFGLGVATTFLAGYAAAQLAHH